MASEGTPLLTTRVSLWQSARSKKIALAVIGIAAVFVVALVATQKSAPLSHVNFSVNDAQTLPTKTDNSEKAPIVHKNETSTTTKDLNAKKEETVTTNTNATTTPSSLPKETSLTPSNSSSPSSPLPPVKVQEPEKKKEEVIDEKAALVAEEDAITQEIAGLMVPATANDPDKWTHLVSLHNKASQLWTKELALKKQFDDQWNANIATIEADKKQAQENWDKKVKQKEQFNNAWIQVVDAKSLKDVLWNNEVLKHADNPTDAAGWTAKLATRAAEVKEWEKKAAEKKKTEEAWVQETKNRLDHEKDTNVIVTKLQALKKMSEEDWKKKVDAKFKADLDWKIFEEMVNRISAQKAQSF
eukprot:TRINITY_DN542_c0_g1_i1.p2 TRINITY_DN542_c0_g1~~TRINITY_DN542_c0_g1_i1.p2  ORF type:complete len:357 (-),score=130.07 TRINITY_DN542_c0_g1_i1:1588-2658(-)